MLGFYESLFTSETVISEQLSRWLLPEVCEDRHTLILAGTDRRIWTNHPKRLEEYIPDQRLLHYIMNSVDDGMDPVTVRLKNGCLIGSELYTDKLQAGYAMVLLPEYEMQTAAANMDFFELLFSQIRLNCKLIEKNNHLYQLQLELMDHESEILQTQHS